MSCSAACATDAFGNALADVDSLVVVVAAAAPSADLGGALVLKLAAIGKAQWGGKCGMLMSLVEGQLKNPKKKKPLLYDQHANELSSGID